MRMSRDLQQWMFQLLGNDSATLGGDNTIGVALVRSPFVPGPNLALGDVTFASFTGADTLHINPAITDETTNPNTGAQQLTFGPMAGLWKWVVGDTVGLNQTIYGYVFLNITNEPPLLYGSALLPEPILLNAADQLVLIDPPQFELPPLAIY